MGNIKGFEAALEALRAVDSTTREKILSNMLKQDPAMVQRLKSHLVLFEDLLKINPQGLTRLFQEVSEVKWVIAFRGQTAEFVDAILKPLASRRAELIRAALAQMGPQSVSKVEAAQREIIAKALELEGQGLLVIAKNDDPLV